MKLKHNFFCSIVLFTFILSACSVATETTIKGVLSSGAATSPMFLDCRAISSTELVFRFSQPVSLVSLYIEPAAEVLSVEEGEELIIVMAQPFKEGEKIVVDILVEDERRNTLNVLLPLRARNDRIPKLLINELRTEYSSATNTAPARVEFVEFITKSAGNLGALRLFIAGAPNQMVYEFPPVEVQANEYIVLHLRTLGNDCVDEIGGELDLSGGPDASPDARDFWVPGTSKLLHKTDAVYLLDQDDRIIDAVLLSEKADLSWGKPVFAAAAELFARQGAWSKQGGGQDRPGTYVLGPADAIISAGTTATRTICRDETLESGGRAECWYITATSSATPGKPNNPKRYVP